MAIRKPAPSSLYSSSARRRRAASSDTARSGADEEEAVRVALLATDAPAQLVELGEAEAVGVVDDDRVRVRDVEARLDDRRRDEHVHVALDEREHPLLDEVAVHLAVDRPPRSRRARGA